jgi:hypothetical protein
MLLSGRLSHQTQRNGLCTRKLHFGNVPMQQQKCENGASQVICRARGAKKHKIDTVLCSSNKKPNCFVMTATSSSSSSSSSSGGASDAFSALKGVYF